MDKKTEIKVTFKGGGTMFIFCDEFTVTWDEEKCEFVRYRVVGATRDFGFNVREMAAWQVMY